MNSWTTSVVHLNCANFERCSTIWNFNSYSTDSEVYACLCNVICHRHICMSCWEGKPIIDVSFSAFRVLIPQTVTRAYHWGGLGLNARSGQIGFRSAQYIWHGWPRFRFPCQPTYVFNIGSRGLPVRLTLHWWPREPFILTSVTDNPEPAHRLRAGTTQGRICGKRVRAPVNKNLRAGALHCRDTFVIMHLFNHFQGHQKPKRRVCSLAYTLVHLLNLLNVRLWQATTLAYITQPNARLQGLNGRFVAAWERIGTVMHKASVVIWYAKCSNPSTAVFVKVVLLAWKILYMNESCG